LRKPSSGLLPAWRRNDDPIGRFNLEKKAMTGPTIAELEARIAIIRDNINQLVEQAAAYSGAGDESRAADRIAEQGQELAKLVALRDALARS
jgi:hypothetical protein